MKFLHKLEKWMIPAVVTVCALFLGYAVGSIVTHTPERHQIISYPGWSIVHVDPAGDLSIPRLAGYAEPALQLGHTVPLLGNVVNATKSPVSITLSVYWYQIPPGATIETIKDLGRILQPGITNLNSEVVIPQSIIDYVHQHGPTKWSIRANVKVNQSNALDTSWETPVFWVVP
jgi:hypothetical protein